MKKHLFISFMLLCAATFAQDYKPYKIKSGKIEYEIWRYKTSSHYSNHNGQKKKWKEAVPYAAEIIEFYWDDFGDKTFEQSWIVADPQGREVPKTPDYEMLTTNGKRYYFNYQENTYREDPDYVRKECMERANFYQLTGSWVKTVYGGYAKGEQSVLGKKCSNYQANEVLDLCVWEGVPLKEMTYKTDRDGKRQFKETTKIAVSVQTGEIFDPMMFEPRRLQPDPDFIKLNMDDVMTMIDKNQNRLIPIDESGREIQEGDIILYVTSGYRLGKMQIKKIDGNTVHIRLVTFDSTGALYNSMSELPVKSGFACDLDNGTISDKRLYNRDFILKTANTPVLKSFPGCEFYLVKASRKE